MQQVKLDMKKANTETSVIGYRKLFRQKNSQLRCNARGKKIKKIGTNRQTKRKIFDEKKLKNNGRPEKSRLAEDQ